MSPSACGTSCPFSVAEQSGRVSITTPRVESVMPSTTRSERMPSSLSVALQVCVRGSRSSSSRPAPVRRMPAYVVSPAALTVNDVGVKARASSKMLPKSNNTVAPFA